MRSPLWFVVAGLIALAGFAGALFYLCRGSATADSRMIRVVVPGSTVLTLDKPGRYTIYHEKKSTVDGRYYASETVNGLRLRLADRGDRRAGHAGRARHGQPTTDRQPRAARRSRLHDRPAGPLSAGADLAERPQPSPRRCWPSSRACWARMFSLIFGTIGIAFAGLGVAGAHRAGRAVAALESGGNARAAGAG